MFVVNEDLSIYVTRGDACSFPVVAADVGVGSVFPAGTVLRIKVTEKKNCANVVLQKDFPAWNETASINIVLNESDTKIGDTISKPKDYWYEIEMNPNSDPKTIIGYDEDGERVFKLFPEGKDVLDEPTKPEDIPVVDSELDLTSTRPVENQAVARAIAQVNASVANANAVVNEKANEMTILESRMNAFTALPNGSTAGDAELQDIRVGADGVTHASAGMAVRKQFTNLQQGTGLIEVREFNIEGGAAVNFSNVLPNATYNFDVANSINVSLVVVYLYDKDGNYVHLESHQPGKPFSVTTSADSDYIKLWMEATGAASGKVYQYLETGHSLDERMRFEESHHKAYNHIAGSTTGKIEFNTSAKTVTVSGLFFFEHLTWKNIASQTLDLTTYEANPSGETVKIVLDKNGNVCVKSSVHPVDPQDVFICLIMITGTWWFSANQIYTNDETKRLIYVDGKQMLEDINKVKSDLVSMFNKATPTNRLTCNIFKRVCVCGDSYTSGHIHDANGVATATNEEFAWPHYMSLLTGNEWINCGQSGANVLTWQNSGRGLSKARSAGKVQAYVIGLMINDQSVGTDRYCELGTKADIGTDAQTYYGGMSKIIRELNAISPKAKIFVQTCPRSNDSYAPYNQAVHDIVEAYKNTYPVHCLDLLANIDMYSNQSLTQDAWYGHYTAIGYEQFAEILSVIMSDYINEHISAFRDVAFIEYD